MESSLQIKTSDIALNCLDPMLFTEKGEKIEQARQIVTECAVYAINTALRLSKIGSLDELNVSTDEFLSWINSSIRAVTLPNSNTTCFIYFEVKLAEDRYMFCKFCYTGYMKINKRVWPVEIKATRKSSRKII